MEFQASGKAGSCTKLNTSRERSHFYYYKKVAIPPPSRGQVGRDAGFWGLRLPPGRVLMCRGGGGACSGGRRLGRGRRGPAGASGAQLPAFASCREATCPHCSRGQYPPVQIARPAPPGGCGCPQEAPSSLILNPLPGCGLAHFPVAKHLRARLHLCCLCNSFPSRWPGMGWGMTASRGSRPDL